MAYQGDENIQGTTTVNPAQLIFRFLRNKERVCIWLHGRNNLRIEGVINGFDIYMNVVMDEAAELHVTKRTRREISRDTIQ